MNWKGVCTKKHPFRDLDEQRVRIHEDEHRRKFNDASRKERLIEHADIIVASKIGERCWPRWAKFYNLGKQISHIVCHRNIEACEHENTWSNSVTLVALLKRLILNQTYIQAPYECDSLAPKGYLDPLSTAALNNSWDDEVVSEFNELEDLVSLEMLINDIAKEFDMLTKKVPKRLNFGNAIISFEGSRTTSITDAMVNIGNIEVELALVHGCIQEDLVCSIPANDPIEIA
jgi:hypothetical protein